jgi:hypothetical protein
MGSGQGATIGLWDTLSQVTLIPTTKKTSAWRVGLAVLKFSISRKNQKQWTLIVSRELQPNVYSTMDRGAKQHQQSGTTPRWVTVQWSYRAVTQTTLLIGATAIVMSISRRNPNTLFTRSPSKENQGTKKVSQMSNSRRSEIKQSESRKVSIKSRKSSVL